MQRLLLTIGRKFTVEIMAISKDVGKPLSPVRIYLLSILVILLLSNARAQSQSDKEEPVQKKQLKVGLVLSGGGGRGLAHVGVLEWFEKHRIPVHYVAGSSMGGLIGGVYSMGMPPVEMRTFLKSLNWNELFSGGPGVQRAGLPPKGRSP